MLQNVRDWILPPRSQSSTTSKKAMAAPGTKLNSDATSHKYIPRKRKDPLDDSKSDDGDKPLDRLCSESVVIKAPAEMCKFWTGGAAFIQVPAKSTSKFSPSLCLYAHKHDHTIKARTDGDGGRDRSTVGGTTCIVGDMLKLSDARLAERESEQSGGMRGFSFSSPFAKKTKTSKKKHRNFPVRDDDKTEVHPMPSESGCGMGYMDASSRGTIVCCGRGGLRIYWPMENRQKGDNGLTPRRAQLAVIDFSESPYSTYGVPSCGTWHKHGACRGAQSDHVQEEYLLLGFDSGTLLHLRCTATQSLESSKRTVEVEVIQTIESTSPESKTKVINSLWDFVPTAITVGKIYAAVGRAAGDVDFYQVSKGKLESRPLKTSRISFGAVLCITFCDRWVACAGQDDSVTIFAIRPSKETVAVAVVPSSVTPSPTSDKPFTGGKTLEEAAGSVHEQPPRQRRGLKPRQQGVLRNNVRKQFKSPLKTTQTLSSKTAKRKKAATPPRSPLMTLARTGFMIPTSQMFQNHCRLVGAHTSFVLHVAFDRAVDPTRIVSVGADGHVCIWPMEKVVSTNDGSSVESDGNCSRRRLEHSPVGMGQVEVVWPVLNMVTPYLEQDAQCCFSTTRLD